MQNMNQQAEIFTNLILELFRLNGVLLAVGDRLTGPAGLSSARWQVLGVVEHGPISVAHVARTMGLTRQTVRQTAEGLFKDGFIVYADNPHHRRSRLMELTPKARAALDYVAQRQAQWASAVVANHDLASLNETFNTLYQLRQTLETYEETNADETQSSESDG